MLYYISNIEWSTDSLPMVLPSEMTIECADEDEIADTLSDETGFLVESFSIN